MKKLFIALTTILMAFALLGGGAEAARKKRTTVVVNPYYGWYWPWGGPWTVRDPRLAASNLVVGGAATGAYFAIRNHRNGSPFSSGGAYAVTSFGCMVVSPILGTIVTNRELTQREVWVSSANCFVPFIGGWAMNNWFDANGWK
jgi:hypothetical protein